ncbi:ubiquitinyl hydrolase [Leucosporidium creatinivorum]|uniref:Ubiquitin carboxyl-terminal hydrolase n=1 Tax=Leucosporidium creatinivorum TaxID=106004 RepID=A0A1Y2F560_9BASI|nr:ubiquitinyl hydrolase [Leucosporidium creatinivorum]
MEVPAEVLAQLSPPRASQLVHREECTQCYDDQDMPEGTDVCLHCFNGACPSTSTNRHGLLHFQKTGHSVVVNIKRRRKPVVKSKRDSSEPALKKLAIREEPAEHEKYDFETTAKMYVGDEPVLLGASSQLDGLIAAVLSSMSSAQKSEVKAWEEEITTCVHTTELVQPAPKRLEPSGLAACAVEGCGLTSNLWLCLTCGSLGCGRQQYGGGGGNGHGVAHTQSSGHPVAVKLGTIEPDGTADVYCYACDDAKLDNHLADHLANFGIEVAGQKKTEKTMTELQVEQNLNFDFAMTGADGKELEPVTGPGLTGLRNLGNSCYMASSLQSLFSLPSFQERYLTSFYTHTTTCTNPNPASCFECQMGKIADGLLSGRYSVPRQFDEDDAEPGYTPTAEGASKPKVVFQEGIRPSMFKALVGKDHPEFSTMRQQDAGEFLSYLLEFIRRSSRSEGTENPTTIFGFAQEQRLQCTECKGVSYKREEGQELLPVPVPVVVKKKEQTADAEQKDEKVEYEPVELLSCLETLTSPTSIDYKCPACAKNVEAVKTTRFATFPDVLLVNAARFQVDNWVPRKVDVPLLVPHQLLNLDKFLGKGKQDDEVELPQAEEPAAAEVTFDAEAMNQLTGMGFPEIRCKRALLATGNNGDASAAMEWLFAHMEDADIDDPLPAAGAAPSAKAASEDQVNELVAFGFTAAQARKALRETGGDLARAADWLFNHPDDQGDNGDAPAASADVNASLGSSTLPANYRLKAFISHKGPSVHSGHYVAHVHQDDETGWILFNDEKVVKAEAGAQSAVDLMPLAYVYIFERIK